MPIFSLRNAPKPSLFPLDPGYAPIEFQYAPGDLSQQHSSSYGEARAFGRSAPIYQYVGGNARDIRFTAQLFAETVIDQIETKLSMLRKSVDLDQNLGRPPLWIFTWGEFIEETVVVESIGDIRYDSVRSGLALIGGAALRSVTLAISLKCYEPLDFEVTSPSQRQHNTFYHQVREGDTWESIARRYYSRPIMGELLRRMNPSKPYLAVGDSVLIVNQAKLKGKTVSPISIPLRRSEPGIALRQDYFETLGEDFVSHAIQGS